MTQRFLLPLATLLLTSLMAIAPAQAQDATKPQVVINTSKGPFTVELYPSQAPISVENFLQYVEDDFYDGTTFHRVISHFMIQGGGLTEDLQQKPTRDPIQNEADNGLKNLRGTIAMARTNDPHSATSQFYVNVEANPALDHKSTADARSWGYTVFGHVIDGMSVVDDIRFARTSGNDVPVEPIFIESVELR